MGVDLFDELHRAEIGPILAVQELPGWLAPIMWAASAVGTDGAVLALLATLYWCVSPRMGIRLAVLVLLSAGLNAVAKLVFHAPRPAWIDARVWVGSGEGSFGLPSGHAQTSVLACGAFASLVRRPAVWWAAGVVAALISFSRVYLGLHFISDVVAGALIGALLLVLYLRYGDRLADRWRLLPLPAQILLSAVVAAALLVLGVLADALWQGWSLPSAWSGGGARDPAGLDRVIVMSGALFGTLAGASVMRELGWFSASGGVGVRVLRWLLGMAGAVALWALCGGLGDSMAAGVLRYTVVAAWAVLGAPLAFARLGLVQARATSGRRAP
ncbi:phosphatase PAP2 family protein [Spongiactinospora sp. TRM90649]|uniref:phosphatase PAP2 family protein n=1 Tax=Spongiactinospora sp. TRM90649 TaxID=3031114 RepID=UPI0023F92062|nr:phosphatase PAP2 family protein [Spongiactinospora sp. TRM90649]MDF5756823.1 phosphatase PAP2 family protein [Spongiactinospora sp. TRM90649]